MPTITSNRNHKATQAAEAAKAAKDTKPEDKAQPAKKLTAKERKAAEAAAAAAEAEAAEKAKEEAKAEAAAAAAKAAATPTRKTVYPDQLNKVIRWTPAKVALFETMRALKAITPEKAATCEAIAEASGGRIAANQVAHQVKPAWDLTVQGLLASTTAANGRKVFYLTERGRTVSLKKQ